MTPLFQCDVDGCLAPRVVIEAQIQSKWQEAQTLVVTVSGEPVFSSAENPAVPGESQSQQAASAFDWTREKTHREFATLHARCSAGKCSDEELRRYQAMKASRTAHIFGRSYLRDYIETQRLRKLTEVLGEVEKYLLPVD